MNYESCIHCGICTQNCAFLSKYKIDLAGFAKNPHLAYHCFLCGECTAHCPKNIDGCKIAMSLRQKKIAQAGNNFFALKEAKKYRLMVWEKQKYLFKSYRHISAESVLFTGCSFPSFYPKTTLKLISLLKERAHMGVVLDCCGKPIWELGMTKEYEKIKASISEKLKKRAVTEIVVICPNCYYFLKENLDIPVISIYEKLKQLNFENRISCEEMNLFIPCPDKKSGEIKSDFLPLVKGNIKEIKGIQCCGLGGEASPLEGKIAEEFSVKLKAENFPAIYTYCASCSGNLNRSGCKNVKHILTELLNTHETLPKGLTPLINRGKFKFL